MIILTIAEAYFMSTSVLFLPTLYHSHSQELSAVEEGSFWLPFAGEATEVQEIN